MKAIILAAGKGTRLQSVEPDVPKPMVQIADTPVLEFTIDHLRSCGIQDFVITAGYKAEQIVNYFAHCDDIQFTVESRPLGTAGGVKEALRQYPTDEPVLVWHGDNFSTCDPRRMLEYHHAVKSDATVAVCWRKNPGRSGTVEWDGTNGIVSFKEKSGALAYGWVSAGIYILEPKAVMPFLPSVGDFGRDVFPELLYRRNVVAYGFSHDEWLRWYDTPEDLAQLRKDYP